ncbi:transporter associated domain-containing protein [Candidatus Mesenet endosymbiont of Agriotes lineatus]|uniref:transporter associated domain-containing protein n=1 Tax=Candidatus Mesenet endosymbiont of Agriotes lineatus TaxID=3077948 RepID=UPI0030CD0833
MSNNVVEICNNSIRDIIIPRAEIYAIDIDKDDAIDKLKNSNHIEVPVYKSNLDNIIGFIHIKDVLFNFDKNISLKSIIRNVFYIPPSMKIMNLFIKMQSSQKYLAIVLDEYGCTEGLVSMIDLVKGIVGSVGKSEYDENPGFFFTKIAEKKFEVSAKALIKEVEDKLRIELKDSEDEDYVTISGLVFAIAGKVPLINEVVKHKNGVKFIIKEANERYIQKLILDLSEYSKDEYKSDKV